MKNKIGDGPISSAFKSRGIDTFEAACALVKSLPYKRCSAVSGMLRVLGENCGTCSSKHELIQRLADENVIDDCQLILCVFKMSVSNTPKVSCVLKKYDLEFIPEAHTYILYKGATMDLTFPGESNLNYLDDVLFTSEISVEQIGDKALLHKKYLSNWIEEDRVQYVLDDLWQIREACILALSV